MVQFRLQALPSKTFISVFTVPAGPQVLGFLLLMLLSSTGQRRPIWKIILVDAQRAISATGIVGLESFAFPGRFNLCPNSSNWRADVQSNYGSWEDWENLVID
ncbi:hypothetical protein M378DRAFT_154626 [Amanita muscaria Koide BX008]|uniref:Uncharacterized protein n=1 Tax=Amanita muscaria (strain Koide BX008) TaxID=946122 RepID=A0A0C2X9U4_AMAMK|nr:hypothetical protein M378DRAFT_154626 [Amanita muscaria Koide BX008]